MFLEISFRLAPPPPASCHICLNIFVLVQMLDDTGLHDSISKPTGRRTSQLPYLSAVLPCIISEAHSGCKFGDFLPLLQQIKPGESMDMSAAEPWLSYDISRWMTRAPDATLTWFISALGREKRRSWLLGRILEIDLM